MKKVQNFQKKLIRMDQLLSFNKQDIKYEILREALEFMTEIGSSISVLFLFLTISIVIDWKLIFLFLPIYLFQVLVVETVKLTFRRKHPKNYTHRNFLGLKSTSGSFPSGHTSNMFCLGYLLCNYFQTGLLITTVIFLIAGYIGLSRVLLGKHYLIDVLAGAVIGLSLAILGTFIWIYLYTNTGFIPRIG